MAIDWIKIKTEYETSNISYRKLADKHNVSFYTLKHMASRENWVENRKKTQHKIGIDTLQKAVKKISDSHAYDLTIELESTNLLNELILSTLKDKKQFKKHLVQCETRDIGTMTVTKSMEEKQYSVVDTKRLQALANTLKTTNDIKRQLLDIIDADKREKLAMDKEKLEKDKEKDNEENDIRVVLEGQAKEWGV